MSSFNPFTLDQDISLSGSTETLTVPPNTKYLRLYPVSGDGEVYINSQSNSPSIKVREGTELDNVDGQITSLILTATGSATINVKGWKNPSRVVVRAGR